MIAVSLIFLISFHLLYNRIISAYFEYILIFSLLFLIFKQILMILLIDIQSNNTFIELLIIYLISNNNPGNLVLYIHYNYGKQVLTFAKFYTR